MNKQILKVGSNERFHTINEALSCACKGDEIVIESGVYRENIKIDKDITITGLSSEQRDRPLIVIGKNHHFDVYGKADIYNIEICQSETSRYYFPEHEYTYRKHLQEYCNDSVNFNNNQLIRLYDDCVFEYCIIRDTLKNIVPVFSFSGSNSFYNCTFIHSQQFCICIDDSSFCRVSSCKFIDNFAGIKTKGYLQVEASEFQNTVFTNVYVTSNSKAIVYGSSFINAFVNIYVNGTGAYLGCYRSEFSSGKVNNLHINNSNMVYIDKCKLHDAGEIGIYVQDDSLINIEESEIYNNKEGFVIDTSNAYCIKSSNIKNNTEYGVYVCKSGHNSRIEDCVFSDNNIGLYMGLVTFNIDKETNNTDVGLGGYGYDPDETDFNDDCTENEVEEEEVKPIIPQNISQYFNNLENSFFIKGYDELFCKINTCCFLYNNIGIEQVIGSCCTYKKCNIVHNKDNGINLYYGSYIYIEDSEISSNENYGIYAHEESEAKVIRCTISDNKKDGTFNNEFETDFDLINCDNQDDRNPPTNYKLLHELTFDTLKESDDLESIFHMVRDYINDEDYLKEGKTDISEEVLLEDFKKHVVGDRVIKYENQIIGYADFYNRYYRTCALLNNLVIDKNYRNKGIGKIFIDHLKYISRNRVKRILIDKEFLINNEQVISFFRKQGFSEDKIMEEYFSYEIKLESF